MAMVQAGMGLTRVVLLVGAGLTGSIVLRNGRLADILGEVQEMLQKVEKGKGVDSDAELNDAIATQVHRLAMEVRQLASAHPITILNGGSGETGVSALIVPAATVGAFGYGYMWWKSVSFSDLMCATKSSMDNAVSRMSTKLEQAQSSLAAAKMHLEQGIETLKDKLNKQIKLSVQIKDEVTDARCKLEDVSSDVKNLKQMVGGLHEKMNSIEAKQNFAGHCVMYLCQFIEQRGRELCQFTEQNERKLPDCQDDSTIPAKHSGEQRVTQGLQLAIEAEAYDKDSIVARFNAPSCAKLHRAISFKPGITMFSLVDI